MKVVYAPSFRGSMDDLHTNVVCGFEIGVLESLCEIVGDKGEVLYFPHTQTPKTYHTTILEALKGCPISHINQMQKAKDTDVLVSDFSNRIFEYSLSFAKPSIVFLSGITGISFNQDKFYKLLQDCAYFAFSLKDLKDICKTLDFKAKTREIESFLQRDFL
ncbi:hypothetical protein [Helicobacter apodemus]|uniref:Uncharacterized protein n=1 Tax=Helicobacter apodemus TaxID=135569 RepID=A0A2U8FFB7_9HELI|nr:hypothetical protein [Helicobacter apodemus]AWI34853.1 hypothetical protein CDV25_08810 [Helicobacter apodemus]